MTPDASTLAEPAFVGRVHELEQLTAALHGASSGRGRLVLLSGEAGIGKTRLADEVATRAAAQGVRVLWGRCWESGGAPAYWPWVQILRRYVRDTPAALVAAQMGSGAADLGRLSPELAAARGGTPPSAESEQARFSLFDATASFLRNAAAAQPLVLVLDDLHAADESSLLLLQFLARDLRSAPLLVIGTYRETEARRAPARLEILSALLREGPRLPLRGLSQEEVGRYVAAAARATPREALVAAIHQATDGNPFFVTEVVRLWVAAGGEGPGSDGDFAIPDEVRAAVRRRLDPLRAPAREALAIASVIGREFDAAFFARVTAELGAPRELLAEAVDAGLLAPAASAATPSATRWCGRRSTATCRRAGASRCIS
jgi:predicted ATPase